MFPNDKRVRIAKSGSLLMTFIFNITLLSWVLGIIILLHGPLMSWTQDMFLLFAYISILTIAWKVSRFWRDPFNPLTLVLGIALLRFGLPGLLLGDPGAIQTMQLTKDAWILGHTLALVGVLSTAIGWLLATAGLPKPWSQMLTRTTVKLRSLRALKHAAVVGMVLGIVALVSFVVLNAGGISILVKGKFRGVTIQEGTGIFFYLSFMAIVAGTMLVDYYAFRRYRWWISLVPSVVVFAAFWPLGGRVRALTPIVGGLLVLWYNKIRKKPLSTLQSLFLVLLLFIAFIIVVYIGYEFRGHKTISLENFVRYVTKDIWTDIGHLHALAGAVSIGPGVLHGRSFLVFLWPFSSFLDLPIKTGGGYIVESLIGERGRSWAVHSSLIGDAYLNFGLAAAVMLPAVFGFIMKHFYAVFRKLYMSRLGYRSLYALVLIYALRMYFEIVNKWAELATIAVIWLALVALWNVLSATRSIDVSKNSAL